MRRTVFLLCGVLAAWPFRAVSGGPAAPERTLVFILDASGSMRAKLGGTPKIAIAKDVMARLIEGVPGGVDFGVIAYGHRRKDDCADVEEIVPVGAASKADAIARVRALGAVGKTPITDSVRRAAATLGTSSGPATIVLVSDGEETCAADPCAAIAELRKASIAFTLHVVGFGVTAREAEQLRCMASRGGGRYETASTARDLERVLLEVQKAEVATGDLSVLVSKRGKLVRAELAVRRADGARVDGGWSNEKEARVFRLLPGSYELVVRDTSVSGGSDVTVRDLAIRAGETTKRDVDLSPEGRVQVSALKDGKRFGAGVSVRRLRDGATVHRGWLSDKGPVPIDLLPGTYEVVVQDTKLATRSEQRKTFEVAQGRTVDVELGGFLEARIDLSVFRDGKRAYCEFRLRSTSTGHDSGYTSTSGPRTSWVLPGTYDLQLRCGDEHRKVEGIVARHGETAVVDVPF